MTYQTARVTLETYEQELASLMRLVSLDTKGDEELAHSIVFSPTQGRSRMSPAEHVRRGEMKDAYEAARDNFVLVKKEQPEQLCRAPRLHLKMTKVKAR